MAGCECPKWKRMAKKVIIFLDAADSLWRIIMINKDFGNTWQPIFYCPWCGSKLTEEAGDAE